MILELSIDGHEFIGAVSEAEDIIRRYCDELRSELRSEREAHKRTQEALAHSRALTALIQDRLEEAGGTLDSKLQRQIVVDLQQDIRQGGETALDWWREQLRQSQEVWKALLSALDVLTIHVIMLTPEEGPLCWCSACTVSSSSKPQHSPVCQALQKSYPEARAAIALAERPDALASSEDPGADAMPSLGGSD